jgi:CRISPR-associated protein Cmr4
MFKKTSPLFLICETPLHAGSGDDLGMVDLPIQRERHTGFPKIEASSLKGSLREAFEGQYEGRHKDPVVKALFGPESEGSNSDAHSGCMAITDARLLLFPVKSMKGVFVWITCPTALNRLAKDLAIAGNTRLDAQLSQWKTATIQDGECRANANVSISGHAVLEEYAFKINGNADALAATLADAIYGNTPELSYWHGLLKANLVVLNDSNFKDFVNYSTEVITRIKIDNRTGTVQDGALFTEEYLPSESVLYSLISTANEFTKRPEAEKLTSDSAMQAVKDTLTKISIFQLGGNATLGKGVLRAKLMS